MRTKGSSKLTPTKRKKLILNLCRSLVVLKSSLEVADALTDLLTPKEIETISKRLMIAELLVKGRGYEHIREELKVGYSTIARVNDWLNLSGKGYKIMMTRKMKINEDDEEEIHDPYSWKNYKRRHSLYFWPGLLLEELLNKSNKKEREKIMEVLETMEVKRKNFSSKRNKELYEKFTHKLKE